MYICTLGWLGVSVLGSDDDRERLVAEIDANLKRLVEADERSIRDIVETSLWREFGGERLSAIEHRIEEKETRLGIVESERDDRVDEIQELKTEVEALRAKKDDVSNERQQYELELQDILTSMEGGMSLHGPPPRIERLAKQEYGSETMVGDVIQDLRDRGEDYDIADDQWGSGE